MPPSAKAMNPEFVKNRPVSNSIEVIGPRTSPPIAPSAAPAAKANRVIRDTGTPIRLAATGFSAQARRAFPKTVRARMYHKSTTLAAVAPRIQNPWVGMRMPAMAAGRSPENAGIE